MTTFMFFDMLREINLSIDGVRRGYTNNLTRRIYCGMYETFLRHIDYESNKPLLGTAKSPKE